MKSEAAVDKMPTRVTPNPNAEIVDEQNPCRPNKSPRNEAGKDNTSLRLSRETALRLAEERGIFEQLAGHGDSSPVRSLVDIVASDRGDASDLGLGANPQVSKLEHLEDSTCLLQGHTALEVSLDDDSGYKEGHKEELVSGSFSTHDPASASRISNSNRVPKLTRTDGGVYQQEIKDLEEELGQWLKPWDD